MKRLRSQIIYRT